MKYSNKILTATSAVALGVGLLIGSTNAVFADNSKTTDSNTDTAKTDSSAKKGLAQTSTSYDLMVKVGSNKNYPVYKKISNGKPSGKIADASDLTLVYDGTMVLEPGQDNMLIFNLTRELRQRMQLIGVFM